MTEKRPLAKNGALPTDARTRTVSRVLFAVVLVLLALFVVQGFLAPIGWAAVIALTTWSLYRRFSNLFGGLQDGVVPPLLFTLLVGLVLFLPVALAAHRASEETQAITQTISRFRETGIPAPAWLPAVPGFGNRAAQWWKANLSDPKIVTEWIGSADAKNDAATTRALGTEIGHRLFLFIVALICVFSFFRHGRWVGNRVLDTADRLFGDPGERLASRMAETIRGTVNGTVLVAFAEGALIGVAYFLAGVPHALLFTLLTMAFAMLPFGAWAVFSAASLLLVWQGGSAVAAAGVFFFGAAVMVIGDIFFWPALVGNAARLPFLIALVGIFGGLQAFGLIGLFLGPVILAALLTVWREWLMPRPAPGARKG
jgi:predicted PurR-regulated permease PerM